MLNYTKRLLSLLLCIAMMLSLLPGAVLAADAGFTLTVVPSVSNAEVGDTVTFQVFGQGSGITALQFRLNCPEGMSYVANSASVPSGLKDSLGWAAIDWTEESVMWTGYSADAADFSEGTLLLTFDCTMDTEGTYQVDFQDYLAFDVDFNEVTSALDSEIVTVGSTASTSDCVIETEPEASLTYLSVQVQPDRNTAALGNTITYSVYASGNGLTALQFNLDIPAGMSYVPGSATVPDSLKSDLGIAGAIDWTEASQMWTMYNDVPIAVPEGTVLMTFQCTADAQGSYSVSLKELLPFDGDFLEFACQYTCDTVTVTECTHDYRCETTTEATCTETGVLTCICALCGNSYTESISALGHSFIKGVCTLCGAEDPDYDGSFFTATVTASPSPAIIGETVEFTVYGHGEDICGLQFALIVPEGMTYVPNSAKVPSDLISQLGWAAADWTEESMMWTGYNHTGTNIPENTVLLTFSCIPDAVGVYQPELYELLAFNSSYQEINTSCTVDTLTVYSCAQLGHDWIDATCTTVKTCDRCGITEGSALGHEFGSPVVTEQPTCTEDGLQVSTCIRCPETYTETLSKTGHSHQAVVTAPTCTEGGYTTHTCHCGDSYTDSHTDALGHNENLVTVEPTCTVDGSETYTCNRCGNVWVVVLPATGHSHQAVVTAPTCTESGYTTHTCHCGDTYTDSYTAALGHSEDLVTIDPTCTADGSHTYTCNRCGNVRSVVLPATGHSYQATVIAPTCTEGGYTLHECAACDNSYMDTYVPATGHRYTAVVTAPTATEQGYTTYTCHCGDSYIADYTTPLGVTLTGDFASGVEGELTLELVQNGQVLHSITVSGKTGSYSIPGILPGDYTLKVSKNNHTLREYPVTVSADPTILNVKICLKGDLTTDNRVNVGDVSRLYAHVKKTDLLTDYLLQLGDLTGEGRVNVGDVSRLYAHVKKTHLLW